MQLYSNIPAQAPSHYYEESVKYRIIWIDPFNEIDHGYGPMLSTMEDVVVQVSLLNLLSEGRFYFSYESVIIPGNYLQQSILQ